MNKKRILYLPRIGEVAEWSNAAVLKTVEGHTSGGSNPSFSAKRFPNIFIRFFYYKPYKGFKNIFLMSTNTIIKTE